MCSTINTNTTPVSLLQFCHCKSLERSVVLPISRENHLTVKILCNLEFQDSLSMNWPTIMPSLQFLSSKEAQIEARIEAQIEGLPCSKEKPIISLGLTVNQFTNSFLKTFIRKKASCVLLVISRTWIDFRHNHSKCKVLGKLDGCQNIHHQVF